MIVMVEHRHDLHFVIQGQLLFPILIALLVINKQQTKHVKLTRVHAIGILVIGVVVQCHVGEVHKTELLFAC